jgi:hypothetical protein
LLYQRIFLPLQPYYKQFQSGRLQLFTAASWA